MIYSAVRLCGLLFMSAYAWYAGQHPRSILGLAWDSHWYFRIAEYGYGTLIPSATQHTILYNDLAFFPLLSGHGEDQSAREELFRTVVRPALEFRDHESS